MAYISLNKTVHATLTISQGSKFLKKVYNFVGISNKKMQP